MSDEHAAYRLRLINETQQARSRAILNSGSGSGESVKRAGQPRSLCNASYPTAKTEVRIALTRGHQSYITVEMMDRHSPRSGFGR